MIWHLTQYRYRRLITITAKREIPENHFAEMELPYSLLSQGKVRSGLEDIEVVYIDNNEAIHILNRTVTENSSNITVEFPVISGLQENTNETVPDFYSTSYYVYWGNPNLVDPPVRPSTPVKVDFPITFPVREGGGISYTYPGEDWVDGVSSRPGARATVLDHMEDVRVIFLGGPAGGVAEVTVDNREKVEIDTHRTSEQDIPYTFVDLDDNLHQFRIKQSEKKNPSSPSGSVAIKEVGIRYPIKTELGIEEVDLT